MTDADIIICGHGSGTPSTKILKDYATARYSSKASNGERKGIIEVRRLKALTDEGRERFHDKYKKILGRNLYSQTLRGFVFQPFEGKYYSDCSSSGIMTFKLIGYKFKWTYNTAAIHSEDEFTTVPIKLKDGHITNPEVLKVGDAILFVGNDSSRPLQIGHVEWVYEINESKQKEPEKETTKQAKTLEVVDVKNYKAVVTASSLNVRDMPGNGDIIATLPKGSSVTVTKTCEVAGKNGMILKWGFIKGLRGWICLAYVKRDKDSITYKITADALNFRDKVPDGKVLKVLKKGEMITVKDIIKVNDKQWASAETEGIKGYCCLTGYSVLME